MTKSTRQAVLEELAAGLPEAADEFDVLWYQTRPAKVRPLVYRRPKRTKVQGGAATPAYAQYSAKSDPDTSSRALVVVIYQGIIVYAIEMFLYAMPGDKGMQTLFVSKADTTGHYVLTKQKNDTPRAKLSYAKLTEGIIRGVLRSFVNPKAPVRVCLFARAEKHYLFPYSGDAAAVSAGRKHVATGSELVRWWIRVLDNVCRDKKVVERVGRARLQIPGAEAARIRGGYLPKKKEEEEEEEEEQEKEKKESNKVDWQVGDVFWPDGERNVGAIRCVPRFPDDPLTRYVDDLVTVGRSTRTSQQLFWAELEARQEFRLSIVVGVIGVEMQVCSESSVYDNNKDGEEEEKDQIPETSMWELNRVYEYISTLDYAETEMNEAASKYLLEQTEDKGSSVGGQHLVVKGTLKVKEEKKEKSKDGVESGSLSTPTVLGGMLVRKKKKKKV
ncbi:uncharacterized protein SAPINGB_P000319 [Magnusiomyces paraingens]|uniref:histone acetyltransferase n=1 Tax=Magnusiomyces paraingens TaxID=2606893 RepID=A0A5E8AYU4_9ASCO|nr:uncharacterized protein SAPINGB_P000319 [Saprochaete ingens]VVT44146.1 unnamed protein product [Saprochaete ingens]